MTLTKAFTPKYIWGLYQLKFLFFPFIKPKTNWSHYNICHFLYVRGIYENQVIIMTREGKKIRTALGPHAQ